MNYFFVVALIVVVLGVCPNNCNGNGKCVNNNCECYPQPNSLKLNFVGSDCSMYACPTGPNFYASSCEVSSYKERKSDENLSPLRVLSSGMNSTLSERMLIENIISNFVALDSVSHLYKVTMSEELSYTGIGAGLNCFSGDDFKMYAKILGKEGDSYIIQFDSADTVVGLDCRVVMNFTDYTLFNEVAASCTGVENVAPFTCTVTWIKMDFLLKGKTFASEVTMKCGTTNYPITEEVKIDDKVTSSNPQDVVFKFTSNDALVKGPCRLYADKDGSTISTGDYDKSIKSITKSTTLADIAYSHKDVYPIPSDSFNLHSDKLKSTPYGAMKCIVPGYKEEQNAYLFGKDSNNGDNYYILYDFKPSDLKGSKKEGEAYPGVYQCSFVEKTTSDLTWYYPYYIDNTCTSADTCKITWADIGVTYPLKDAQEVQFACVETEDGKTPKDGGNLKIYNYIGPTTPPADVGAVVFTVNTKRDNMNYPSNRICYLLGKINADGDKIESVDITNTSLVNNIIQTSSEKIYTFYTNLPQTVDGLNVDVTTDFIYKLNGLYYNVTEEGGTLECYERDNNQYFGKAYILRKNSLNYYIKYEIAISQNKFPSAYRCDLSYKHNDLSLYIGKLSVKSKVITMENVGYFLKLMGLLKDLTKSIPFLCKSGDAYGIYNFKITSTTDDVSKFTESELGDLLFTTESEITDNGDCYMLINSKGDNINVLESDLNNEFTISQEGNKYKLEDKIKYDNNKVTNLNIDVNENGVEIDCYDFSESKNQYVGSYNIKMKIDNTYYLSGDNDISKYKCYLSYKYTDLSLFGKYEYKSDATSTSITLENEGFYLKSLGFLNKVINKDILFLCGTASSGSDSGKDYQIYKFKLNEETKTGINDFNEKNLGNVVFIPIDENTPTAGVDSCFMLSDVNGNEITDPTKSNLKHKYTITENDGQAGVYTVKEIATADITKVGIYHKNPYVYYDIGTNGGGLLHCYNTAENDKSHIATATILGKSGDDYIIDYSTTPATPDSYKCILTEKYNDISYLTTDKVESTASNTLTLKGGEVLKAFSNNYEGIKQIACRIDDKSEIIVYNVSSVEAAEPSSADYVKITIDGGVNVAVGTICHILTNNKGEKINLMDSDLKYNHLLQSGDRKEYKYSAKTVTPPPNPKPTEVSTEEVKINGNIGELGGKVECFDSTGKSVGTATIFKSYDNEGKEVVQIVYDFAVDEKTEYTMNVVTKMNDLSSITVDAPPADSCYSYPNGLTCQLIFDGFKSILESNGFYSDIKLRSLDIDTEYDVACIKADGKVHIVKYVIDRESAFENIDSAIFEISQSNAKEDLPVDEKCSLLSSISGIPLDLSKADISSKLKLVDGVYYVKGSDVKSEKGYEINNDNGVISIEYSKDYISIFKENYIVIADEDFKKISEYFMVGKWIKIGDKEFQVIKISSDGKYEYPPVRRMLSDTYTKTKIIFNKKINIDVNQGGIISFTTENGCNIHIQLECSGAGSCDRTNGVCTCFAGFTGDACQRLDCPNNCNGNGRCVPLNELLSNEDLTEYNPDFDKEKIYGCLCDKRHRGYDCSLIECPSGEDPEGATNTAGSEEKRDCSGRGICNYNTGICECFDGFSGEGCQNQAQMM